MERRGERRKFYCPGRDRANRKDLTYNEHIPYLQMMLLNTVSLK